MDNLFTWNVNAITCMVIDPFGSDFIQINHRWHSMIKATQQNIPNTTTCWLLLLPTHRYDDDEWFERWEYKPKNRKNQKNKNKKQKKKQKKIKKGEKTKDEKEYTKGNDRPNRSTAPPKRLPIAPHSTIAMRGGHGCLISLYTTRLFPHSPPYTLTHRHHSHSTRIVHSDDDDEGVVESV